MKDFTGFTQVGQPYSEVFDMMKGYGIMVAVGIVGLAGIAYIVRKAREEKKEADDSDVGVIGLAFIFFGLSLFGGLLAIKTEYPASKHIVDYQGTFKVVQSEANKIDTTTDSDDKRKITLEDNKGNQQVFEASDNQVFHKGDKAVVKVKALGETERPSLSEKIGGDKLGKRFEIVSIKPEKQS